MVSLYPYCFVTFFYGSEKPKSLAGAGAYSCITSLDPGLPSYLYEIL